MTVILEFAALTLLGLVIILAVVLIGAALVLALKLYVDEPGEVTRQCLLFLSLIVVSYLIGKWAIQLFV